MQFFSADFITDIAELCRILDLPETIGTDIAGIDTGYPLRVSHSFVNRIEKGNPNDPLLLQILPQKEELQIADGFTTDPLEEMQPGQLPNVENCCILQKYAGRSLLLATNQCGIHCRFCFRRWTRAQPSDNGIENILRDIDTIPQEISEIILSGGDPLMLNNNELSELFQFIKKKPQLKRVRIHTRVPVCYPQRLDTKLFGILSKIFPLYIVLHINHPNELDRETAENLRRLAKETGAIMLSQTVLLKGINDNADILGKLFSLLADIGVIPYYLHQLDKVQGTAHFEVQIQDGLKIMPQLEKYLPGYAVPKYVQEIPNEPAKVQIRSESRGGVSLAPRSFQ